jgi:pimeloyl-ACP methyl ester carboxylesterase
MRVARAAIADGSLIAETVSGPIEYAEEGSGIPLLSIHGAGGGFDQGLDFSRDLLGGGYRIIAPSRFGYVRTPVPADPSPAAQADAHAALLDTLGVDKAVVVAVSAGARSAVELAVRHPERVSALVLVVPGIYAPDIPAIETTRGADFPLLLWLLENSADFMWWVMARLTPDTLVRFVGVPPQLLTTLPTSEREKVMALVRDVQPVSRRYAGIAVDGDPQLHQLPLETIDVPTIILTARDDLFSTLQPAQYAAAHIPGARLMVYDTGGHILVGHGDEVNALVREFLAGAGLGPAP